MDSTEIIEYKKIGFDSEQYFHLQRDKIVERISMFKGGKLYLEIGGGKILYDPHAARVLPGFDPYVKRAILESFKDEADIMFCTLANDIQTNRQLKNSDETYQDVVLSKILKIQDEIGIKPKIVINMHPKKTTKELEIFKTMLRKNGFQIYSRYYIDGYPQDVDKILSKDGYGRDEYIGIEKDLVIVTGAAANSGKLSTCIGQIYLDQEFGVQSGYAKFETFPIWNLPLKHPVNLAYEAATADNGDYNMIDQYHMDAHNISAVNYNRDLEAFEIVKTIASKFVKNMNYMRKYKSPTDMGVNYAGYAINNDEIVSVASFHEIQRREEWYQEMVGRGEGHINWVNRCRELKNEAVKYINEKDYDIDLQLY